MKSIMRKALIVLLALPLFVNAGSGDAPSIFWAALANDVHMAEYYVSKGESVNVIDEHGLSPLMYAADKGNYEMVKFLLEVGADPTARTPFGAVAVEMARTEEIRRLLQTWVKEGSNQ
jgi:uncharacterized protein